MVRAIERVLAIFACVTAFLLMLITVIDVGGRWLFNSPLLGATELTELALVGMIFAIYPRLAYRRQHIEVDLSAFLMGRRTRHALQIVSAVLGAVVFVALAWRLAVFAQKSAGYGETTAFLSVPVYWAYSFMALMSALTGAAFLLSVRWHNG